MTPKQDSEQTKDSNQKNKRWDSSIIIALIAVLISSASAYISLKESQIMLKQQKILSEQQEASVWPYLQNQPIHNYNGTSEIGYKFVVTNKGIGPAIIDEVVYKFDGGEITGWGLGQALKNKYPSLRVEQQGNAMLDGKVLAPGESHIVIREKVTKLERDTTDIRKVLDDMDFYLEYCYCSVYGKCWKVEEKGKIKPSEECQFRENIR